ncbi:MAG: hypothetical protein AABX36_03340 [Candidatus Thermoplasmatota archaeon]|jgi:hypothetical protein
MLAELGLKEPHEPSLEERQEKSAESASAEDALLDDEGAAFARLEPDRSPEFAEGRDGMNSSRFGASVRARNDQRVRRPSATYSSVQVH